MKAICTKTYPYADGDSFYCLRIYKIRKAIDLENRHYGFEIKDHLSTNSYRKSGWYLDTDLFNQYFNILEIDT